MPFHLIIKHECGYWPIGAVVIFLPVQMALWLAAHLREAMDAGLLDPDYIEHPPISVVAKPPVETNETGTQDEGKGKSNGNPKLEIDKLRPKVESCAAIFSCKRLHFGQSQRNFPSDSSCLKGCT